MERKSFFGLVIGAVIGLLLLFLGYMFFFRDTETGKAIRDSIGDFFPIGGDTANSPDVMVVIQEVTHQE